MPADLRNFRKLSTSDKALIGSILAQSDLPLNALTSTKAKNVVSDKQKAQLAQALQETKVTTRMATLKIPHYNS